MSGSARPACMLVLLLPLACEGEQRCADFACDYSAEQAELLRGLANLPPPPPDASNKYLREASAIDLGKKLFFDPNFSGPPTYQNTLGEAVVLTRRVMDGVPVGLSCASCHDLRRAGADTSSLPGHVSVGVGLAAVNARQTVNAYYYARPFWNGREDSLWGMIVPVLESPLAMGGDRVETANRLLGAYASEYARAFSKAPASAGIDHGKPGQPAYDALPQEVKDQVTETAVNFAKAIAAYEYELVSRETAFDRYVNGGARISDAAVRGARLFVGKASCISCHSGPFLSDGEYHNIGVPMVGEGVPNVVDCSSGHAKCDCGAMPKGCQPFGYYDGVQKLKNSPFRRDGKWSDEEAGKKAELKAQYDELAATDAMKGRWRTPSLRDVAVTGPYMHTGVYRTLEEVVDHYNWGGTLEGAVPETMAPEIRPLGLTPAETRDLVAFLETLTSDPLSEDLITPPPIP